MVLIKKAEWILCPACQNKTRIKVHQDTVLLNFPLFCPKCKHETLINVQRKRTIKDVWKNSRDIGMISL